MNRMINRVKKILNKDVTSFLNKYKIPLIGFTIVVLLACVGLIVSYAFYQTIDTTPIIGGTTGKIADIDIRIMAEQRDANGNGLGSYDVYPYIPKAGYEYNSSKSYCVNKSTIAYDSTNFTAGIIATGHDICYLYFDSTASLDLTLNVYAENISSSSGEGTGEYTKLETTTLPSVGYTLNTSKSSCTNGGTISYDADTNMFSVETNKKDVCNAYMDALDVDIALKLFVETKSGSGKYYETKKIPSNIYYSLGSSSACTGSSTMSLTNQSVVVAATSKTNCVAYLNVSSGPILESMEYSATGDSITVTIASSSAGTKAAKYYYSNDNGATYVSSTSSTYTFSGLTGATTYKIKAYSVDSSGKTSAILATDAETSYVYNGYFDFKAAVQTKVIEKSGYYILQVWGAQGGYRSSATYGGKGGYAEGTVYLNAGDTIYIHTGGFGGSSCTPTNNICSGGYNGGGNRYKYPGGGGATDIRINSDSLYARVIVAGGGGSDGATSKQGMYGGGTTGGSSTQSYGTGGYGGTQTGNTWITTSQSTTATNESDAKASFGFGGNGVYRSSGYGGAGGGGWYGGSGSYPDGSGDDDRGGGGGSGYIYTSSTASNYPSVCLLNEKYYLKGATLKDGSTSFTTTDGTTTETGHSGNGYAKVTYDGTRVNGDV